MHFIFNIIFQFSTLINITSGGKILEMKEN